MNIIIWWSYYVIEQATGLVFVSASNLSWLQISSLVSIGFSRSFLPVLFYSTSILEWDKLSGDYLW